MACPSTFLALKVQLDVLVSAFVMVTIQFGQFLVCRSSTHGAPCPAICKSEKRALWSRRHCIERHLEYGMLKTHHNYTDNM